MKNLKILLTITDGGSSKVLTLTPGKCSKRFKLFKSVSSRRLKKLLKKTLLFKRRKNFTLS